MNITLSSTGNVAATRGEKITRGQSRSKLIKVNWRNNESPPELPISDAQHIAIEELVVQVNITRPDGEYSGWQDMIKIDGEIAFYYPLQKWDTGVSGKAQCQIRWFKAGEDGDDDDTTVQTSNQVSFIVDNGAIAQTVPPSLEDYTTWQAIITGLQARALKKYDVNNLPVDVVFNADGKKSAPAIYFNVSNGDYSGLLIVSKHELGYNTIQTETLFAIGGIFTRTITFSTADYNDTSNENPTGTATEYRDITKNNLSEAQLATLSSGITAEKVAEIDNKVEKSNNTGAYLVYARKAGVEGTYEVTMQHNNAGLSIPLRNANGSLEVPAPTGQYESANKKFVEDTVSQAVSSVYKYKGSVLTVGNLPNNLTEAETGWVYDVQETDENYAWTGSGWDKLSGIAWLHIQNGAGDYSLMQKAASGEENTATYEGAIALGKNNKALNKRAFVGGSTNTGAGHTSFTYGQLITNRGGVSIAFGKEHILAPDPDIENNTVVPQENFVAGHHNVIYASQNGGAGNFIAGLNNFSKGSYGTIFGSDNYIPAGKHIRLANSDWIGAFIAGAFADADKDNLLFAIGNGDYDPTYPDNRKRQNAFEVYYNGQVKVKSAPIENDDVVRKLELDNAFTNLNIKNGSNQYSLLQKSPNGNSAKGTGTSNFIAGNDNEKYGPGSNIALFGLGNKATYWSNAFVIGQYNNPSPTDSSDPAVFQIGWGSNEFDRANVFEVTRSGVVKSSNIMLANTDFTIPSSLTNVYFTETTYSRKLYKHKITFLSQYSSVTNSVGIFISNSNTPITELSTFKNIVSDLLFIPTAIDEGVANLTGVMAVLYSTSNGYIVGCLVNGQNGLSLSQIEVTSILNDIVTEL